MCCTIEADLSRAPILTLRKSTRDGIYYAVQFEIILLFGKTELQAQVAWMENVSGPHMLPVFDLTDIGLILRVVSREKRNGKFFFKKKESFLNELP